MEVKHHAWMGLPRHSELLDEMPIPQDCDDAIIHTMSKPLEEPFFHDRTLASMVIFHNYVTLKAVGQL
jgi:hypothetical protein